MSLFVSKLKESGHLDGISFTIGIIGSRKLEGEDYAGQGWTLLAPNLTIYGFDADSSACQQMNKKQEAEQTNWTEKHIPLGLWNKAGKSKLHVTQYPACSSLYPPSQSYIDRFVGNSELIKLVSTEEVETTTLDDFCQSEGVNTIDFLQIDTQGAELNILKGASKILSKGTLALKVEVEFIRIYENQPLFSDVDIHLREQGFSLFDFGTIFRDHRRRGGLISQEHPGQLIWTDAFYFRDLIQDSANTLYSPEKLVKLACIADILNFYDYALELLEYITWKYGDNERYNFANHIVEVLSQYPDFVKQGLDSLPILERIKDRINNFSLKTTQTSPNQLPFNLSDINLIVFPDWSQPEESLSIELGQVIKSVLTHPKSDQITLLIDSSNISGEEADLALSSIIMNLMMEEELEVSDEPNISLIGQLSDIQWSALMPHLQGRIVLEHENQDVIKQTQVENLPTVELDSLNKDT